MRVSGDKWTVPVAREGLTDVLMQLLSVEHKVCVGVATTRASGIAAARVAPKRTARAEKCMVMLSLILGFLIEPGMVYVEL